MEGAKHRQEYRSGPAAPASDENSAFRPSSPGSDAVRLHTGRTTDLHRKIYWTALLPLDLLEKRTPGLSSRPVDQGFRGHSHQGHSGFSSSSAQVRVSSAQGSRREQTGAPAPLVPNNDSKGHSQVVL
ncbi:hypothetical protein CPLU01_15385 [Colletotrichum plurivorum]|uniref:Uncharacterized protein n=1 Tax=Colletotrichum plurivorum TaxID=2175906 RepID=A0A8H6JBI0_9PEZI|nr:hypothetical protein CPLU01_15385 [Colletotrichum plurivorum]